MARDAGLEAIIAEDLETCTAIRCRPMFGGLAWLWHGKLLCFASEDGLMVGVGKAHEAWACTLPGVVSMVSGQHKMGGWVELQASHCGDDALRQQLLQVALTRLQQEAPPSDDDMKLE